MYTNLFYIYVLKELSSNKHKPNLYFQEVITVNKEARSLYIERVATTSSLRFYLPCK